MTIRIFTMFVIGIFGALAIAACIGGVAHALPDAGVIVLPPISVLVPDPTTDPGAFAGFVLDLVTKHAWLPLFGALLVGATALARWGGTRLPGNLGAFFASRIGGYLLNFLVAAVGTTIGTALAGGAAFSGALFGQALAAGFVASGVYQAIKDLASGGAAAKL